MLKKLFQKKWLPSILFGIALGFCHPFRWQDFSLPGDGIRSYFSLLFYMLFFVDLIKSKCIKEAIFKGFLFGQFAGWVQLVWINVALTVFGNLPIYVSLFAYTMLCLTVSVPAMVASFGTFWYEQKKLSYSILVFILCVCTGEWIQNWFLSGFPWGSLSYAFHENLYIIQWVSIVGTYGLNFILLSGSALILTALKERNINWIASAFSFWLILYVGGTFMFNQEQQRRDNSKSYDTLLLQGNIEQGIKNKMRLYRGQILDKFTKLLRENQENEEKDLKLVVWPESSLPMNVSLKAKRWHIAGLNGVSKAEMVVGAVGVKTHTKEKYEITNSAFLLSPELEVLGNYHKSHLVPFGEYAPLEEYIPLKKIVSAIGSFLPGKDQEPLDARIGKVGVLICYEGVFPEITRQQVLRGAETLVNITNDAWYGFSSAAIQHLAFYKFRAIENRRDIARSANTGISGLVKSTGEVDNLSDIFVDDTKWVKLSPNIKQSLYTKLGDWLIYICFALLWAMLIRAKFHRITKSK